MVIEKLIPNSGYQVLGCKIYLVYDLCRIFDPSYIAKLRINTGITDDLCRNV